MTTDPEQVEQTAIRFYKEVVSPAIRFAEDKRNLIKGDLRFTVNAGKNQLIKSRNAFNANIKTHKGKRQAPIKKINKEIDKFEKELEKEAKYITNIGAASAHFQEQIGTEQRIKLLNTAYEAVKVHVDEFDTSPEKQKVWKEEVFGLLIKQLLDVNRHLHEETQFNEASSKLWTERRVIKHAQDNITTIKEQLELLKPESEEKQHTLAQLKKDIDYIDRWFKGVTAEVADMAGKIRDYITTKRGEETKLSKLVDSIKEMKKVALSEKPEMPHFNPHRTKFNANADFATDLDEIVKEVGKLWELLRDVLSKINAERKEFDTFKTKFESTFPE